MTGVLTTGLPSLPNFPENSPVQLDNDVEKSKQSQLFEIVPTTQVTPPEFMLADETPSVTPSAIAQKSIDKVKEKLDYEGSANLRKLENSQTEGEETFVDSLYYSNAEPELILMSEATTGKIFPNSEQTETLVRTSQSKSTGKILLASTSLVQLKAVKRNIIVTTSHPHPKKYVAGGGISQQQRPTSKPVKNNIQVVKFLSSDSPSLPVLSFGNTGNGVRVLQRLLIYNGYGIGIDGVFGALTEAAVKAFQNRRSLTVDGIVGERTWYELTK